MSDSDYTKNNTNFYDLLPEVYKNDFTKSMFNNLFNRYVTKDELKHTDGYIGVGNPNAEINRNIKEPTPNRQAYQLQPMLYSKIGTVEHMATWKDILNELDKVGVDTDTLKEWFTPQKFNWVPPIDIDKLLHYRDYYWYNPENPTDIPQYLTIKNICNTVKAKVTLYEKIIGNNGDTFQITGIDLAENTFTIFSDLASIFSENSIFYTRNAPLNPAINDAFWNVVSATYDSDSDSTTIKVTQIITNDTISGEVSLNEFLDILNNERDCVCNGALGFDKSLFDDNQIDTIMWNTDLLNAVSHATLNSWVLAGNDLTGYDLWYDTANDQLKQFSIPLSEANATDYTDPNNWVIIKQNMSVLIARTEGQHFFDLTVGCTYPRNQWVDQNFWTHKSVIPNFSIAKQAEIPIIEFQPFIELNEWTCKIHQWAYRPNKFTPFELVDNNPSLFELIDIDTYKLFPGRIELDSKYGDLTGTFNTGYNFNILNSVGALYPISGISTGLGGSFTVVGDVTNEYTSINDLINPNELPFVLKIRNSPGGLLDHDWTIDNIDIISDPGKSVITVISTEVVNTFSFAGSEVFQTNNGQYSSEYALYERIKSSYQIVGLPNYGTNQLTIDGDIAENSDFTGYFFTNQGAFEYTIAVPFDGTNTILDIQETISASFTGTEIYVDEFKTVIKVAESFNIYSSITSNFVPLETSVGDVWNSYNTHWVYKGIDSVNPVNRQNLLPGLSLAVGNQIVDSNYSATYSIDEFEYKVNRFIQYYLVKKIGGIHRFEFQKAIQEVAIFGENDLRVYIKDEIDNRFIRQYGNYTEIETGGFVTAIEFNPLTPVPRYSEIKIEVGPAVIEDIGMSSINVRTEENDDTYDNDPAAASEDVDLSGFDKNEQVKIDTNQYPLFDLYDTSGNSLKTVSEIFKFKEDVNEEINFNVNLRIVVDPGDDFVFQQELIEEDNSELFTYRDNKQAHLNYFVNSTNDKVLIWSNFTWNDRILLLDNYLYPITSSVEPTEVYNTIEGQIWYNPETIELKIHNGTSFQNVAFEYGTIDPTLKTIWQPGLNQEFYDPKYVNGDREEVTVGDVTGDWETPDPLYYNVHHENRKEISLLYLTSHFNTIINSQPPIPGFSDAANNTFHINTNPNYGLGGTIREYNDGFDILAASTFIDTATTRKILDFAQNQYSSGLIAITETLVKNLSEDLTNVSDINVENLFDTIINDTLTRYELNDINSFLYIDSPSYDGTNGIKNWIATLPMFGFSEKTEPFILDSDQNMVTHHDGHISTNNLVDNVRENIIFRTLKSEDIRSDNGDYFGNTSIQYQQPVPTTETEFNTAYGSIKLSNGKYWYTTLNNNRILLRMNLASVGFDTPGTQFPENSKWYDTSTNTLYTLISSVWTITTTLGDSIISSAWEEVDLNLLNTELVLTVETKLYNVLDDIIVQKLDFASIATNSSYTRIEHETFNEYIKGIEIVNPLSQIGIYNTSNPFTWNYIKSDLQDLPYISSPSGDNIGGCWQDIYEKIYGTAFPHREPWILQGYEEKPGWWDTEYKDTTGARKWIYNHGTGIGMWANILDGIVPVGYILPNLTVSTGIAAEVTQYSYLSVMINDNPIGIYQPDDILPPYWDFKIPLGVGYTGPIRSLFHDFTTQIISPNIDYKFGDKGSKEWIWNHSVEYQYDLLKIYYRIDPLEFYHKAFGIEYNVINDLQIDRNTKKVYSHVDSVFHGELFNENEIFKIEGINQWYTNYNRFFGIDSYISNFKGLWNDWTTPLTYQFGSFIDTESFDIQNKNFDLVDSDLAVTMKKSLGIKESWIDALKVAVLKVPNVKLAYETSYKWSFDVSTNVARDIEYYDIKKYPIAIDNDTCTVYKFKILNVNTIDNFITISGNWDHLFNSFEVVESTNNNNTYTLDSIVYDSSLDVTIIKPVEPVDDSIVDGFVISDYRTFDWDTGQEVRFESTQLLPRPFVKNQTYYIIKVSGTEFKLADTRVDATNNIHIEFDTLGSGELFVGEIVKTFTAISNINSTVIWNEYAIDTNNILVFNSNKIIYGIQTCIDIVTGYSQLLEADGWQFNYDNTEVDIILGRTISWQLELEKFINQLFVIQKDKQTISDTYDFSSTGSILNFANFDPSWPTGTKVLLRSIGTLPAPLVRNTSYFIIRDDDDLGTFTLAQTVIKAKNNDPIIIISDGDASVIESYVTGKTNYVFELNPFRNNIWYNNEQGIISDIIKGPYNDISIDNTIYDQNNNVLNTDKISIYRTDSIAKILMKEPTILVDQSHISGFHLFVDGYEHVLFFNNYSSDGFLIYDPYVGLNTARFDLIFDKQTQFTLRPNIGGKLLIDKTQFISNIESLTKNLEAAYSTYSTSESNNMTKLARRGLGYNETEQTFLDKLEINDKSQFVFWKGLIQHKGSTNAITAFVNSRRFVDAKLDEYWCYKIGTFGDVKLKIYPEIKVNISDTLSNELKIEFIKEGELPEDNFTPILINDESRWFEYPNQKVELDNSFGSQFYFNAEITNQYPNTEVTFDPYTDPNGGIWTIGGLWYFKTIEAFDSLLITYETATDLVILDEGVDYNIINSKIIEFIIDPTDNIAYENLTINILNVAKTKHNPLKIIDYKSDIKLLDIPIWNPGKGHNYHLSEHFIDLRRNTDPAEYTDYKNVSLSGDELDAWKSEHTDTIWLDDTTLDYYPYYDEAIESSTIDRIRKWGKVADYNEFDVYQWTESKLHPDEWNAIASTEELDKTISDKVRKSGRIRECVYNNTVSQYEKTEKIFNEYHILDTQLVHPIETIIFNGIEPVEVKAYVEEITPKYNIKGYINGIFEKDVDILPEYGNRIVDFAGTITDYNTSVNPINIFTIDPIIHIADNTNYVDLVAAETAANVADMLDGTIISNGDKVLLNIDDQNGSYITQIYEVGTDNLGDWKFILDLATSKDIVISVINGSNSNSEWIYDGNEWVSFTTKVFDFMMNGVNIEVALTGSETWDDLMVIVNLALTNINVGIIDGNVEFAVSFPTDESLINLEPGENNDLFSILPGFEFIDNTTTIEIVYTFDTVTNKDLKTIVWSAYDEVDDTGTRIYPTQEELEMGEYVIDTPFTQVIKKNEDLTDDITYFYWVKNKTVKIDGLLSMIEIKNDLINIPIPYTIIQNPLVAEPDLPNRYNQLIIKGLSQKINDNDRYKIKFVHDFTLRDNIDDGRTNLSLKNTHEEWKLFREKQPFHIDRYLWDKVTESVLGKTLNGKIRIPLLDKELYDIENVTDTRYGLNPGQLFIDANLAIDAIYHDLYNPDNDFYPVDIDSFVQTNNFDNEENSLRFMDDLYNKFASEHLNRIFFSILHIAMSRKLKYDNLMKTSMISLHGIRILETNGIYDD